MVPTKYRTRSLIGERKRRRTARSYICAAVRECCNGDEASQGQKFNIQPLSIPKPIDQSSSVLAGVIVMDSIRHMLPSVVSAPNMRLYVEHSNYYTSLICRKRQQTQKQQN